MLVKGFVHLILNNLLFYAINVIAASNYSIHGEITDIETIVGLNEKEEQLQLKLSWKDNLPKGTWYNVIMTAVNSTQCYEMPCSLYGILKPENYILIPENSIIYTGLEECSYMFGCNYTVRVENSNAAVFAKTNLSIPYCVSGVCSCQHENLLPKVVTVGTISNNHTIHLKWSINIEEEKLNNIQLKEISIIINQQTNPSLSWGGKNLPLAEKLYPLANHSWITSPPSSSSSSSSSPSSVPNRIQQGTFEIKISRDLKPETVLNVHSNVIDELQCRGPSSVIKLKVPAKVIIPVPNVVDDGVRTALIIVTALFLTAIISIISYCVWIRNKFKQNNGVIQGNEEFLTTEIPMEKNMNYIPFNEIMRRNNNFEVSSSNINIEAEIGEGAFGRVFRATAVNLRHIRDSAVVAVKQLKNNSTPEEEMEFLDEIKMLQGVGAHKNIVCFLGCCTLQRPYFVIMEYVGRGDLLSYLRTARYESIKFQPQNANYPSKRNFGNSQNQQDQQQQNTLKYLELKISSTQSIDSENETLSRALKPSLGETTYTIINDDTDDNDYAEDIDNMKPFEYRLDHKELHDFALQIANGMKYLEEQEITHRDLAARNVLIDDRKVLKISDFGLSRHGIYINTKTRKLPLRWLSIEAIRDNIYSNKSDVWAYGVVLWEIGTLGASPYPAISNHELIPFLLSGKRLDKPDICTDQVYALMLQCWNEDPDERPSFEELFKILSPENAYIDISTLNDDYVFPPIKDGE